MRRLTEIDYELLVLKNEILSIIVSDENLDIILREIENRCMVHCPEFRCSIVLEEDSASELKKENISRFKIVRSYRIVADKKKEGQWNDRLYLYSNDDLVSLSSNQITFIATLVELASLAIQRKKIEKEIRNLAFYDPLTGLPNRRHFMEKLISMINGYESKSPKIGLVFIDLDHFKWVNDSLGHDVGDQLLVQTARRIQASVGNDGFVARLGGDEFTVILNNILSEVNVRLLVVKIFNCFKEPFLLGIMKLESQ